MDPTHAYHRIIIDLDLTGGPVGLSVETYVDSERISLTVMERPGPFDTPLDCLAGAIAFVDALHGHQPQLPL